MLTCYTERVNYIIVGLGNPGEKYEHTRHNAGRSALFHFRDHHELPEFELRKEYEAQYTKGTLGDASFDVILPETFMNDSGKAVRKLLKERAGSEIVVLYDDIDLPFGTLKISHDRGSGGHHGVDSLIEELGTRAFTRVRIGIAPLFDGVIRKPQGEGAVPSFLLKPFTTAEEEQFTEISKHIDQVLVLVLTKGVAAAMNAVN